MTPQEVLMFCDAYGTTFPSFDSWFGRLSTPDETVRAWASMLKKYSLAEAQHVLDEMSDGLAQPVPVVEYGHFAIHLRQCMAKNRDDRNRHEQRDKIRIQATLEDARRGTIVGKNGREFGFLQAQAKLEELIKQRGISGKEAGKILFDSEEYA